MNQWQDAHTWQNCDCGTEVSTSGSPATLYSLDDEEAD